MINIPKILAAKLLADVGAKELGKSLGQNYFHILPSKITGTQLEHRDRRSGTQLEHNWNTRTVEVEHSWNTKRNTTGTHGP